MNGTRKPKSAGTTYFDPHTWEFSDSPPEDGCHCLVKMPCWLALLACPLMGLVYLASVPLVAVSALLCVIGGCCREKVLHHTPDRGNLSSISREDRDLASRVIAEIEQDFLKRRRQG